MAEDQTAMFEAMQFQRLAEFRESYGQVLACAQRRAGANAPRVLSISSAPPLTEVELCLLKSLSRAHCAVHAMVMMQPELVRSYYEIISPDALLDWRTYWNVTPDLIDHAETLLADCATAADVVRLRRGPVRVGGHALSLARRFLRVGTPDLASPAERDQVRYCLAASLAAAIAAQRVLDELRPSLVLAIDTAYSPKGEILDACSARGIPFIRWYPAHKSNALMFKRYSAANLNEDLNSLSNETWEAVRTLPWSPQLADDVSQEIAAAYQAGDWYGESGTQFETRLVDRSTVVEKLALATTRKTAFIFPHISWDASFGRGEDLFSSYEEWLVETVRVACATEAVQWIIKVHPAHVGKSRIDQWKQPPSEDAILARHFPVLPHHVKVLPADVGISTWSLFPVMDYCLTVRGTVGLEAARLGIPVFTGGTGRYDRRGFTIDSSTRDDYLARVAHILEVGRMTAAETELANRYAHGLFRMRPMPLTSLSLEYSAEHGVEHAYNRVRLALRTDDDWEHAADLNAFATWALRSSAEDYVHEERGRT